MKKLLPLLCALLVSGCGGPQSALDPKGSEAARIDLLFWIMTAGGAAIFVAVLAFIALALTPGAPLRKALASDKAIIWGGVVFPIVTLSALLVYGLLVLRAGAPPQGDGEPIRIAISGEQWWWRVRYLDGENELFETANEIRVPKGAPVELELTSPDVIHSFWAPKLAGKLDLIPGRTNILRFTAGETGESRGQCAEYCGGAHALMSFDVIVLERGAYEDWLQRQASEARAPQSDTERRGLDLMTQSGCGACHTLRGAGATGRIGPDLTHVGGRRSLAAATLPNEQAAFRDWIRNNQHIKPGNLMPPFQIFSESDLNALASYLESLE